MYVRQIEPSLVMPCPREAPLYFTIWHDFTLNDENENWGGVPDSLIGVTQFYVDCDTIRAVCSLFSHGLDIICYFICRFSESRSCPWFSAAYSSLWRALPAAIMAHFPREHIHLGRSFICQGPCPYRTIKILAVLCAFSRISKR